MRLTNYTRDRNVCPHLLILVHKWPQENSDRLKRCLTVLPEPNKGTNCKFIDNKLSNFDLMEAGLPQTIFGRQGLHSGGSSAACCRPLYLSWGLGSRGGPCRHTISISSKITCNLSKIGQISDFQHEWLGGLDIGVLVHVLDFSGTHLSS